MLVSCIDYTVVNNELLFSIRHSPTEKVDTFDLGYQVGLKQGYMYYKTNDLTDEQAKKVVLDKLIEVKYADIELAQLELDLALKLRTSLTVCKGL